MKGTVGVRVRRRARRAVRRRVWRVTPTRLLSSRRGAARTSSRGSEGTVASAAAMSRSAGTSRGGVGPAAAATARSWSAVYVRARRDGGVVGIGDESWSWSADSGAWTMPSGWPGCAGRSWSDQRASRVARRGRGACGSNAGGGGWGGRRHRRTCSRAWAVGCRSQPRRGGGGAWTHSPPPSPGPIAPIDGGRGGAESRRDAEAPRDAHPSSRHGLCNAERGRCSMFAFSQSGRRASDITYKCLTRTDVSKIGQRARTVRARHAAAPRVRGRPPVAALRVRG